MDAVKNRFGWTVQFAILLALAGFPARAMPQTFTIAQAMSAPFPELLTAAPAGGTVAWVFDQRGARNVWVATPPDHHALKLTTYNLDDGQEIDQLQWTPDGQSIVYVRGGDFEMRRADPNPRSYPQGVKQEIWIVSIKSGLPRRLAEGHSPAVSPRGDTIAYILKDQIWSVKADGSGKPAQLIHALGKEGRLAWSPDGTMLAYVSRRSGHSLIGVYNGAAQAVEYLDPSVDRDVEPVWSPDNTRIAFIRIPASTHAFAFGPRRAGEPWSIRVADVATGVGKQIWKADEGPGSVFRGVVADHQLLWTKNNRLVFPWEKEGWLHLYSVAASGGPAALLSPGAFEVEDVSPAPDGNDVLYNSNQSDIERRHLWRVAASGGTPVELTHGDGIEWAPNGISGGNAVALLRSNARRPARVAILRDGKFQDLAAGTIPADFPVNALVRPQPVSITASDGLKFHGDIFLPPSGASGRHPAVIFVHGGSRRQMLLGWHPMDYYNHAYALNEYLASRGTVVLAINYRSGIGYGLNFREPLNYGATGASEFNDVMGAGLYLAQRPDVDPSRIGIWGGSYGGYLTAMALSRASKLFRVGVDMHGVFDWNDVIRNFVPAYNPLAHPKAAHLAFESSPAASMSTWRSPVLVIQGDDDRNVPFSQSIKLVAALRVQHVAFEQLVLPDEIHGFLTQGAWIKAYQATSDFLDRYLHPAQ
ncbi:MAG TPA: prolyl oligopeptidase family serine peptidase [Terriglobia bacterium]|nr:prolyl oligopeptidase family serine peptidase [Terriglobia bacterium]